MRLNNKYNDNLLKSVVLSTLLFSTNSFSDALNEQDMFKKAVDSYNSKNFQNSYLALSQFAKDKKLNSNLSFMLARSAYEMGKFSEAEIIYKELLNRSTSSRVKLELAQTLFQQKKFDEAKVLYEEVLKDTLLPANVRKGVELTLASLERGSKKNFFKTTLGIGYAYDSNADNTTRDDFVYIGATPFSISDKPKKDSFKEMFFAINHNYKIKDSLTIDNKFVGFMQDYKKENDNDLKIAIIGTGLSYYQQNYKLSVGFDYNYVWLDNKSYLKNYIINPSFEYQINENLIHKNSIRFIKKDFIEDKNNFRDSKYYELESNLILLTNKFGINTFGISLGTDNKDKGKALNVDYNFASLKYENMYSLTENTLLTTGVEYGIEKYKVKEPLLYKNKRENNKLVLDLALIHSINKNLSLATSFRYIDNKSNQNIYQYDKYIAKTNLYISF